MDKVYIVDIISDGDEWFQVSPAKYFTEAIASFSVVCYNSYRK